MTVAGITTISARPCFPLRDKLCACMRLATHTRKGKGVFVQRVTYVRWGVQNRTYTSSLIHAGVSKSPTAAILRRDGLQEVIAKACDSLEEKGVAAAPDVEHDRERINAEDLEDGQARVNSRSQKARWMVDSR